jgi:hypothetical protein
MSDQILEKYDIAISYLSRDEELAYAIYTELGQVFKIFIYTQHQKELAGGDGIELLRDIFIEKTNLVVILYGDGWGKSDWTNTEEKAIQEFRLNNVGRNTACESRWKQEPKMVPRHIIFFRFSKIWISRVNRCN